MNSQKIIFSFIIISAIIFGIAAYFKIPFQFYIWEIFFDLKVISLLILLAILFKKDKLLLAKIQIYPRSWFWKSNLLWFSVPIGIYLINIFTGLLFDEIKVNKNDNSITLILATIFDIPAIFIFSITTVYIEELFFRNFVVSYLSEKFSHIYSIIASSLLWMFYNLSEIMFLQEITIIVIITILLYFFSIGCFTAMLYKKHNSIFPGYSFRIGIISLTPIIITSVITESDSFFSTTSNVFFAEGILVSAILLTVAIYFIKRMDIKEEI